MTRRSAQTISRQIQTLFTAGSFYGLSDRQLLDRFTIRHDTGSEAAFAVLLERHGPMVLGVCRRILYDAHDAEDAFQATFLVLVRQAGSIRVDGSLGRWLYGVASRVAGRARANNRRRQTRERSGLDRIDAESRDAGTSTTDRGDLQSVVADELAKLPPRFQAPLVLCDLEGSSHEAAAKLLGCQVGTIKSRLSRARARLRTRLIRRGLAPPDRANHFPLFPAAVPPRLAEATNQAARAWILRSLSTEPTVSTAVATLTEGVLWTMFFSRLKFAAAALFLIGTGSLVLVSQATAQKSNTPARTEANTESSTVGAGEVAHPDEMLDIELLERAWVDAINRRDAAVVGRILADNFSGIDSAGGRFTRASYLTDVRNGTISTEPIVQKDIKVQLLGDSAVATSRIRAGNVPTISGLTNVYVKSERHWRCVASQTPSTTAANPPQRAPVSEGQEQTRSELEDNLLRTVIDLRQKLVNAEIARTRHPVIRLRSRFDCVVQNVNVKVGQTVKKGDPLMELSSPALAAAKRDYRTRKMRWEADRTLLASRQKLAESDAVTKQLLVEVQNEESRSLLDFQIARGKLMSLGLDDAAINHLAKQSGDQDARFTFCATLDGRVLEVGAKARGTYDKNKDLVLIVPEIQKAVSSPR
jgi:RNA polymerase sigma factor (sigma-70 family)